MPDYLSSRHRQRLPVTLLLLCALLMMSAACGGNTSNPSTQSTPVLASRQVLTFPNVGTQDIGDLDPVLGPDSNSLIAVNMIYSGLVRPDRNLNVIPDQAKT